MSQPAVIVYSADNVDQVPMLPDDNAFTGSNTFSGTTKFGGTANYVQIDGSGEMTFVGSATVWDDLPPSPIISAKLGATAPTLATFVGNVEQYTFDATNDFVIGASEITHAWKEGSEISPHIHWATNGSGTVVTGVKWDLEYTIGDSMGTFSPAGTLSIDATIPANTSDRTHFISNFSPTIDGSANKIGAYICWKLSRSASGTTAPASDPFALAVGFHVEQDSVGSKGTVTK